MLLLSGEFANDLRRTVLCSAQCGASLKLLQAAFSPLQPHPIGPPGPNKKTLNDKVCSALRQEKITKWAFLACTLFHRCRKVELFLMRRSTKRVLRMPYWVMMLS
jgi:hypothetical protein